MCILIVYRNIQCTVTSLVKMYYGVNRITNINMINAARCVISKRSYSTKYHDKMQAAFVPLALFLLFIWV